MRTLLWLFILVCSAGFPVVGAFADTDTDADRQLRQQRQPIPQAESPPRISGSDILQSMHDGRVVRITLSTVGSYDAERILTVFARFEVEVDRNQTVPLGTPVGPLQVVVSSTGHNLLGVDLDELVATPVERAFQVRANGTVTIRIDARRSTNPLSDPPSFIIRIVDPVSGTASNPVTVQGEPPSWTPYAWTLALLAAMVVAYFFRSRRGKLVIEEILPTMSDVVGARLADSRHIDYAKLDEVPDVPLPLVEAISAGQGFLSIGTEAARQAGFRTGHDLLRMLFDHFQAQLPQALAAEVASGGSAANISFAGGSLGKGMDVLLSSVPRETVIAEIAASLQKPSRAGREFYRIAIAPPWRGVLSLAWDDMAFEAIGQAGGEGWQRLRPDEQTTFTSALRAPQPIYLDVLGQLEFPASLSLSMEELRRNLSRNPEWQRGLSRLMQSHSFLFVGTEPSELEQFLQALYLDPVGPDQPPRHFALAPMGPDTELWTHSLARFGVALLPYGPAKNHRALREFMDRLRSETASSSAQPLPQGIRATPHIAGVSLRNIGPFESLDLHLVTESARGDEARPWTVVFGSNGMGKSTILRAMSLALIGADPRANEAGAKLLRSSAKDGSIELRLGGETLRTRLYRDGSSVIVDPSQVTPVQAGLALVLGFPSLRGAPSPNPAGPSSQKPRMPEAADLLPLLHGEVDDRLGSFKQWLLNILVQAGQNHRRAVAQRQLLDRIIREIVPGDIEGLLPVGTDFSLMVQTADGPVPFDSMSQGMSSIFNWLGVLVQRLYQAYPDSTEPENEEATVIVDEIDAHLHPDWQRRLVGLTKANFPRVQVIASSHSPLLAGALHAEEMCVLQRGEGGQITQLKDVPDLFGQRSQVILTSPAFDLSTDRNPEVESKFVEYFDIYEKANPTSEERAQLAELKEQLAGYNYGGRAPIPESLDVPDFEALSDEQARRLKERLERVRLVPESDSRQSQEDVQ